MNLRLVTCLIASALVGFAVAAVSVVFGLGVFVAILVYSGVSSLSVVVLSLASMPREASDCRPALLQASVQHIA